MLIRWWVRWFSVFFFSSRRRHTRLQGDWSSDVCSSDLDRHRGGSLQRLPRPGDVAIHLGVDLALGERRVLPEEIGRASCRERSVDLGGRRIIKKKKKKSQTYRLYNDYLIITVSSVYLLK